MATGRSYLGHAFYVYNRGEFRTIPEPRTIPNVFDHLGMKVGLARLPGERNDSYRKRLMDVYVRRAGSHYQGLINGITRELGLELYNALTISSTLDKPRVIVTDSYVKLLKNDATYEEINIYNRDSETFFLTGLKDAITSVDGYTASIISGVDEYTRSTVLIPSDSLIFVDQELLYPLKRNKLENTNITPGSVKISSAGGSAYLNKKLTEAAVVASGDYYIDHDNGLVISYDVPPYEFTCQYTYSNFPVTLSASPAMLFEFNSETFREQIFSQTLQENSTYEDGIPTSEAVDYINELLAAKGMLWGE